MYLIEKYANKIRFNEQYKEIQQFLMDSSDTGYNEHFHWGRFEWMMNHTFLDVDKLPSIAFVRNDAGRMVGLITYDTEYDDRFYLIHSVDEEELLDTMVQYVMENDDNPCIKVNGTDVSLANCLQKYAFGQEEKWDTVLETNLEKELEYQIPDSFQISPVDFEMDNWSYQLVIHKGFNHEGVPERWDEEVLKPSPNHQEQLRVFALNAQEYCAHCGIWYQQGETAYIEPVVTIPECRKKGLAKAVVYEAMKRAKKLGAKRAVVLSEQEFYYQIGFTESSAFYAWRR